MIHSHRLIVSSVGLADDGQYTITASNNVGETVANAKLTCHSRFFSKFIVRSSFLTAIFSFI